VNNPLRFGFTGCERAAVSHFADWIFYVAPSDYRVMDLKDNAFQDRIDFPDL
jgi:hypothetical protein